MYEEKVPPNSVEAEQSILGAVLIDRDAITRLAPMLEPADFYQEKNGWIFEAMLELYRASTPIDYLIVCDVLERKNQLGPIGGRSYITSLVNAVPTSLHAEHYASIVKRHSVRRALIDAAQKIAVVALKDDEEDPANLIAEAEATLSKVGHKAPLFVKTVKSVASVMWDNILSPQYMAGDRVFTGLPGLDSATLGIESSRFWVGAAVPRTGKSAFAINLVRGVAKNNKNVVILYFHPEQSAEEITSLLLSCGTPRPEAPNQYIPPLRLKALQMEEAQREEYLSAAAFLQTSTASRQSNGRVAEMAQRKQDYLRQGVQEWEYKALDESQQELGRTTIILHDPSGEDIHKIRSVVRRVRAKTPPDTFLFVVFDGMHLIPGAGEKTRVGELMTITRTFKMMAQKDIAPGAVLVNHQLNRQIFNQAKVNGKRYYHFGLLRDSGSIEQDADVIYFLDRPSVWENGKVVGTWDDFDLVCEKNRQTSSEFRSFFKMHTATMRVEGRDVV